MTTKDFERLNLKGLRKKHEIIIAITSKMVWIYHGRTHILVLKEKLMESDMESDYVTLYGKFEFKSFLDITEEQFKNVFMLTDRTIAKYIWLQRYLKGEVDGTYDANKDNKLIELAVKEAINNKQEKIEMLENKLNIALTKCNDLKKENKDLKIQIKKYDRVKKAILEIRKIDI